MRQQLLEYSFAWRFVAFVLIQVAVYYWTRYVVAPAEAGGARLVRALVVVPLLTLTVVLFDPQDPLESIIVLYAAAGLVWIAQSKIWSLCWNRGTLVKCYDSKDNAAFAATLLLIIRVDMKEEKIENKTAEDLSKQQKRGRSYNDVQFSTIRLKRSEAYKEALQIAAGIVVKFVGSHVMGYGYRKFDEQGQLLWRDGCCTWFLYFTNSAIQDMTALSVLLLTRLKIATNFDFPFAAQSMTELWAKRYNLAFGEVLRHFAYEPLCEGRLMLKAKYYSRNHASKLRRMVALFATFVISGVFHACFSAYAFSIKFSVLHALFFVACALVIAAEAVVKSIVKRFRACEAVTASIPSVFYAVYTTGVSIYLAHLLFWPDIVESGAAGTLIRGVTGR